MYYKIKREVVPQYLTTIIPTLTHNYFTRRTADQRNRTYHAFADHNCLHAMIDLLNKSPLIKAQVTTSISLPHFVSLVKQQCFRQYEHFCNVNTAMFAMATEYTLARVWSPFHYPFSLLLLSHLLVDFPKYSCSYNYHSL